MPADPTILAVQNRIGILAHALSCIVAELGLGEDGCDPETVCARIATLTAERDRLAARLAMYQSCDNATIERLRAVLAAERGEKGREGWYWADGMWVKGDGGPDTLTAERDSCPLAAGGDPADDPWLPTTWTVRRLVYLDLSPEPKTRVDVVGTWPTALEAMEAADRAADAGGEVKP